MKVEQNKMTEADLARHFVEYYRDYEVFKEVPMSGGKCDIVVRARPVIICVEVKLTLNVDVIYQALRHRWSCNYTYIGIPLERITSAGHSLCRELGIGILTYDKRGSRGYYNLSRRCIERELLPLVREYLAPNYRRSIHMPTLQESMKEAIAGAQINTMSEFKVTVLEIIDELKRTPDKKVKAKDFFNKERKYHYSSPQSARQCICRLASYGAIPELDYKNGFLILK